jgi:hypothetical protein
MTTTVRSGSPDWPTHLGLTLFGAMVGFMLALHTWAYHRGDMPRREYRSLIAMWLFVLVASAVCA